MLAAILSRLEFSACAAPGSLVDLVLWGPHVRIDASRYSPDLQSEIQRYLQRWEAYRGKRVRPTDPEQEMIYQARDRYERRLAAISDSTHAADLAAEYVEELRPCYEWEGSYDCPEKEARFAVEYQKRHPDAPFADYLSLLAAHRWLCASEACERDQKTAQAARTKSEFEKAISRAHRSGSALIRTAAEELMARHRCYPEP